MNPESHLATVRRFGIAATVLLALSNPVSAEATPMDEVKELL